MRPAQLLGLVKLNPIAPGVFGLVHGQICPLENVFLTGDVINKQGDADACRAVVLKRDVSLALMREG
jgi:hypothetical protein